MTASFVQESVFSASPEELFGFHERPDAFRLLTPSWLGVEVHQTVSTLAPSDEVASFTTRFVGVPLRFEMAHTAYEPPHLFVDEQRRGLCRPRSSLRRDESGGRGRDHQRRGGR